MTNEANGTNLVTLPKEVAEAIENIKSGFNGQAYNIQVIRSNALNSPESDYGTIFRWIARDESEDGVHEYFAALVNGYRVKATPEEMVRQYYEKVKELSNTPSYAIHGFLGEKKAIVQTLDLLGIKIEGVNE